MLGASVYSSFKKSVRPLLMVVTKSSLNIFSLDFVMEFCYLSFATFNGEQSPPQSPGKTLQGQKSSSVVTKSKSGCPGVKCDTATTATPV